MTAAWRPLGYAGALGVASLLGLTVATQFVAWKFGYQPALGHPVTVIDGTPWYWPWRIVDWLPWRGQFRFIDAGVFLGALAMAIPFAGLVRLIAPRADRFGRGIWASAGDVRRAGLMQSHLALFEKAGTILGRWRDGRLLCYAGDEHQMVVGASRSGKTVGFVIPTLLSWQGSVVVFDPKRELYAITARFRGTFSHAFYLDFTDPCSASFNPLDEVRLGSRHEIADVQNIVAILVDPGGSKDSLDYWEKDSSELLLGVILHVLHGDDDSRKNLAAIRQLLLDLPGLLAAMRQSAHGEVRRIGDSFEQMPPKQLYGVKATASTALILYADPLVAEKTSRSDFRIADLVCLNRPLSLYIQLPPSDANRLRPLSRLLLSQIATLMMENLSHVRDRRKQHTLMMMVDEFATLGRLDCFTSWIRVMASYGLQAVLILQSDRDLADTYGPNNTISENCPIQVLFPTSDDTTLRRISTAIGNDDEARESRTYPRWFSPGRSSRSVADRRRAVLEPGQIRAMPRDEQLILATACKPIRCKKVRWYDQHPFRKRGVNTMKGAPAPPQHPAILKRIAENRDAGGGAKPLQPTSEPAVQIGTVPAGQDGYPALGHEMERSETSASGQIKNVARARVAVSDAGTPAEGQKALPPDDSEADPSENLLAEVIDRVGWGRTEAARLLFPVENVDTVRRWISGARRLPDAHVPFVTHLHRTLAARPESQAALQAWLLSVDADGAPVIDRLRNGEVIEAEEVGA